MSFVSSFLAPKLHESNQAIEYCHDNNVKIPRWRARQQKFTIIRTSASVSHVLNLFDSRGPFWDRFGFIQLFNLVTTNDSHSLGTKSQYLSEMAFILKKCHLTFHLPSPTKFHHSASHLISFGIGVCPDHFSDLFVLDFDTIGDIGDYYPDLEYESVSIKEEVEEEEEEEEEEKEGGKKKRKKKSKFVYSKDWSKKEKATLLFLRKYKSYDFNYIKLSHFADKLESSDALKAKYKRLTIAFNRYLDDRSSESSQKFQTIFRYYNELKREDKMGILLQQEKMNEEEEEEDDILLTLQKHEEEEEEEEGDY